MAKSHRSAEHRFDAFSVHSLYIQQICNNKQLFFCCSLTQKTVHSNNKVTVGSTHGSASNVSFFFFSNCSLDIILHKNNLVNDMLVTLHKMQAIEKHPHGHIIWGYLTDVCGCAGSSPRVTLFPWISLKHFSQKWYLLAIRPYFRELQPPYTIKHRKTRTQM